MAAIPVPADGKAIFQLWIDTTNLLIAQGAGGITGGTTLTAALAAVALELAAH